MSGCYWLVLGAAAMNARSKSRMRSTSRALRGVPLDSKNAALTVMTLVTTLRLPARLVSVLRNGQASGLYGNRGTIGRRKQDVSARGIAADSGCAAQRSRASDGVVNELPRTDTKRNARTAPAILVFAWGDERPNRGMLGGTLPSALQIPIDSKPLSNDGDNTRNASWRALFDGGTLTKRHVGHKPLQRATAKH
jgi:hypothetical protein